MVTVLVDGKVTDLELFILISDFLQTTSRILKKWSQEDTLRYNDWFPYQRGK